MPNREKISYFLRFKEPLESKYMLERVERESNGLKLIFIALAIVNPAFIALDFVRLEIPISSVYTRTILEIIFIGVILIHVRLKKDNVVGYQILFVLSSFITHIYLLISDYVNQGEYYELFVANTTILVLLINASFISLRFRHSIILNLLVIIIFTLYSTYFSSEPYQSEQIPFVLIFFVICSILSYLLERISRSLFKRNQFIEEQNRVIAEKNKELSTQNELKNSLMSILTHDIKSPLSSLEMLLDLKSKDVITQEDTISHFNKVGRSVKSISQFVSNMILWIKSQMDGLHVKRTEVNVKLLVDEICILLSEQAAQKNISIDNNISEKQSILLDKEMTSIVVRNILSNAIKFSHKGGKVTIQELNKGDIFKIQIIDAGIGMDEDQLNSLFSMDVKESSFGTGNETGTGLGLLLSYNLMRKMEGDLECKSIPSKGSIFTISLKK